MYTPHNPHTRQGSDNENTLSSTTLDVALEILRGQARNRRRPVRTPAFLIGTTADCDLVLGDDQFPEVHTCLMLRDGGVWLRCLGFPPEITVNGTVVGGRTRLEDGDVIRTGPYEFRISIRHRREVPTKGRPRTILSGPHRLRIHSATMDAEVVSMARELLQDIRAAWNVEDKSVRLYVDPAKATGGARDAAGWMQARGA